MPRKSRIDAAGALHHVMVKGIEKGTVFRSDTDRNDFLERLGEILRETKTTCYAWSLIPNHFHLLLRTGSVPISTVMRRNGTRLTFKVGGHQKRMPYAGEISGYIRDSQLGKSMLNHVCTDSLRFS
jgi:REP element-mobilizing transposase RayT